jgi:pimeloyl-ACP methyl ester carboxylesterase
MSPRSVVLVHGAGSGPWVFDGWDDAFPQSQLVAVDLQDGVDVSRASHRDYEDVLVAAVRDLTRPLVACGWSLGGLVVMTAAERLRPDAIVLLESSPPAEVQGYDGHAPLRDGVFDPEETYGGFPSGMRARTESMLARAERKRGIAVPSLPAPTIVVAGSEFPDDRGAEIAAFYGAQLLSFPEHSHWQLVRDPVVRRRVAAAIAEL